MPIIPNFLERLVVLKFNQAPGPLLDLWSAVGFRITVAAIRLGVFDTLQEKPCSTAELAEQIKTDAHATAMLLDTLQSLGYVQKRGERYLNTPMTTKWLTRDSFAKLRFGTNLAPFARYWDTLLRERWDDLEESLRVGKPTLDFYAWIEHHPELSRDFQEGMIALAHFTMDEVISNLKLPPTARRVLDVGGGHATYSIELCKRSPNLSAAVFDSPQALTVARENIAAANMTQRVTTREGDFRTDDLGADYDAALLFNIIHGLTPDENTTLFERVARALGEGGQIVILEQLAGAAPLPMVQAISKILGMSYLHLMGGQIYTFSQVATWLKKTRFATVRRVNLLRAPGIGLIFGTKI